MARSVLGILVWLLASAGAVWLARSDSGVSDAPALIVPQEFRVAAAETGRLAELQVAAGQRVLRGQLLARLDTTVLEREIAMAEARLRQLSAEPGASEAIMDSDGYASERSFQTDVDDAAAQLETAQTAQSQQAAETRALRDEIARQRRLVKEGLTRAERVEELEVRLQSLEETAKTWPARLRALTERQQAASARLREWRTQHKASSAPVSRDARLKPLLDRITEQREALRMLRARLTLASIVAPADGEVVSLLARPGDIATSGTPFVVLHGTGPQVLVAYVNERARLTPGAKAMARRRTPQAEELPTTVQRVADVVVQIPQRFWLFPTMPQWGREVYLELPAAAHLDAGEAVDVKFLAGSGK